MADDIAVEMHHAALPARVAQIVGDAFHQLAEIEAAIATLKATPHKGNLRDEITPGLRAIPAGRKAVIAFVVDGNAAEALVYAVTYGGADWAMRSGARSRK